MLQAKEEFIDELRQTIEAKRTFGRHALWRKIQAGQLALPELQTWATQFFLQVREFPRAVSALHASCPFATERAKLAESLYEEETGRVSGCDLPHPELFLRFTDALRLDRPAVVDAEPLPATLALIDWFERSTKQRSYLEGAAAITLAAEGQVPGHFGVFARALRKHYGLSEEQVAFWDVHEEADRDHSDIGNSIVIEHAVTEREQATVREALTHSLDMWWWFFDGVERAG